MSFTQLDPPIPVQVAGKGKGLAFAVIDYGIEHNLLWVTAIDETGEIWCAPNPIVRMQANWSAGRSKPYFAEGPTKGAIPTELSEALGLRGGVVPRPEPAE
ncbi:hypothetical protein [Notoacmeibacter sp. MSK16QG-6]|uniref:hypothetical protein n=1 Tax=Notoacmeibacter sp. MSK16QG-6 TaxID=2957982 RepID=UPI00209DC11F|nr:hypothetical protein [Notoacmeibacter sp. MSK16QG-6]MCP1197989.1 hypothetical protein [Notoacmeibacter sp. MSK16QG-6]